MCAKAHFWDFSSLLHGKIWVSLLEFLAGLTNFRTLILQNPWSRRAAGWKNQLPQLLTFMTDLDSCFSHPDGSTVVNLLHIWGGAAWAAVVENRPLQVMQVATTTVNTTVIVEVREMSLDFSLTKGCQLFYITFKVVASHLKHKFYSVSL